MKAGVHCGEAGGIVPDSFRILRNIISSIEDENTGEILIPELFSDIPEDCI